MQHPAPSSQAKKQPLLSLVNVLGIIWRQGAFPTPKVLKTATKMSFNRWLSPCAEAVLEPAFPWHDMQMCAGLCSVLIFPTTRIVLVGVRCGCVACELCICQ